MSMQPPLRLVWPSFLLSSPRAIYALLSLILVVLSVVTFKPILSGESQSHQISTQLRYLALPYNSSPSEVFGALEVAPISVDISPTGDYWLRVDVAEIGLNEIVELRLLRPENAKFWSAELGQRSPKLTPLRVSVEKGGLSIFLEKKTFNAKGVTIVGSIQGAPARKPKIFLWQEHDYRVSLASFDRTGGLLIGTFISLAVFSLVVGVLNKDLVFVIFAGWLVTSTRVSLVNNGWDFFWIGSTANPRLVYSVLTITLVIHALLTLRLFRGLFEPYLTVNSRRIAIVLEASFFALLILSHTVPMSIFYPAFWTVGTFGIGFLVIQSFEVLQKNFTATFGWYSCGWIVTILGFFGEIARAYSALGIGHELINSRTGSVAGALLTAVALAERMRNERSRRLKAETRSKVALQRFKENYNSVPVGLATIDLHGDVLHFNPSFKAMFNVTQASSKHSINRHFAPAVFAEIKERLKTTTETSLRVTPKDTAPGDRAFSIQASIRDNMIEASIQEITKEYEAEIRLKRLAHYDTLTDLLNRRGLEKALKELQPLLDEGSTALSIAYFDLDKFKLINDLYGYQSGDEVIKEMGRRLTGVFRAPNVLARAAGDEFIVLMIGSEGEVAKNLCRHAVMEINERSYQVGGKSFNCHVSAGIATVSKSLSVTDALAYADRACREAKNSQGDERIVLFDPNEESFKRLMGEAKIEAQMGQDLPLDRFFIVAQPIVSLQSPASSFNYEVLVRMRGENNEVLNPGHFLKAIERNGLVSQLDRFVLRSTLQWLDQHPQHVEKLTYASVNLSGGSLNDHRFLEDALAIMQDFKDLAPKICFEITETVALGDIKNTRHFADRVKSMGCMLALDDFGAGYTSFAYMKEFPADVVKIDGAYVKNMRRRSMDYAIVRAVTDLSHEIGMSVVAEWAETPDLIAALARMGVDYGQGWALGKPMDMERLLEGNCAADFVAEPELKKLLNNPPKPNFRRPGTFAPGESRDFEGLIIPGVH